MEAKTALKLPCVDGPRCHWLLVGDQMRFVTEQCPLHVPDRLWNHVGHQQARSQGVCTRSLLIASYFSETTVLSSAECPRPILGSQMVSISFNLASILIDLDVETHLTRAEALSWQVLKANLPMQADLIKGHLKFTQVV